MDADTVEYDKRQVFRKILKYTKEIKITRKMQKDMRIMREMRHDNINPFLGGCIEAERTYLLFELCTKRSLLVSLIML